MTQSNEGGKLVNKVASNQNRPMVSPSSSARRALGEFPFDALESQSLDATTRYDFLVSLILEEFYS
jgi:hypothetical protein